MTGQSLLYEAALAYVYEKYANKGYKVSSDDARIFIINASVTKGPAINVDFDTRSIYGSMLVKNRITEMYTIICMPFNEHSIIECIDKVIETVFITQVDHGV